MNLASSLVLAIVLLLAGLAVYHGFKKRQCGCSACSDCTYQDACQKSKNMI